MQRARRSPDQNPKTPQHNTHLRRRRESVCIRATKKRSFRILAVSSISSYLKDREIWFCRWSWTGRPSQPRDSGARNRWVIEHFPVSSVAILPHSMAFFHQRLAVCGLVLRIFSTNQCTVPPTIGRHDVHRGEALCWGIMIILTVSATRAWRRLGVG